MYSAGFYLQRRARRDCKAVGYIQVTAKASESIHVTVPNNGTVLASNIFYTSLVLSPTKTYRLDRLRTF